MKERENIMLKLSSYLLISLVIVGCSREHRILEVIDSQKDTYKLYILPLNKSAVDSSFYEDHFSITRPILIDDQKILKLMKKDWVLTESTVPAEKSIRYKLILYDDNKPVLFTWLDEKYKILIWEDELLTFDDSLLFKYKDSFTYLPEFDLSIKDVESARVFRSSIVDAGGLILNNPKNQSYWEKYDGKYELRRSKNDLKPSRQIGKLREKIKDDFSKNEFYLIGFEFDFESDSMTVEISSDSTFIEFIPESYKAVGSFIKFDSIKFSCVGLEKSEIEKIAEQNKIGKEIEWINANPEYKTSKETK